MKKFICFLLVIIYFLPMNVNAGRGCCSKHGGQNGCNSWGEVICKDGTTSPTCTCTPPKVKGCTDPEADNYNAKANTDNGSCKYTILGCTDKKALNYDSKATKNDDSCIYQMGCTDKNARNYDSSAVKDDGSCLPHVLGCMDKRALNYDSEATKNDNSCEYQKGCTDVNSQNYDSDAVIDDGSCIPHILGCMNKYAENYNNLATKDDGSCIVNGTLGCMDKKAINYNSLATINDDSCSYESNVSKNSNSNDNNSLYPPLLLLLTGVGYWIFVRKNNKEMNVKKINDELKIKTYFDNKKDYYLNKIKNIGKKK